MQRSTKKLMTRGRNLDKTVLWLCVAALVILSILVWWFFLGGASLAEQKKMEMYLKDKYGKEFVVGKPERKASGLGVEGYLEAEAYPKDDSSLKFEVRSSSTATSDEYAGATWAREEKARLNPTVKKLFGNSNYKIEVVTSFTLQSQGINMQGSVINLNDGAAAYGHKIAYTLDIFSNSIPNDEQKNSIAKNIIFLDSNIPYDIDVTLEYTSKISDHKVYGVSLGRDFIRKSTPEEIAKQFREFEVTQ